MIGLNLGNVVVHLRANTIQFERALMRSQVLMRTVTLRFRSLGRKMSLYATTPITLIGGAAVTSFARFDNAMTKSLSIMDGITGKIRLLMEQQAKDLAEKGVKSATELAESYYFLASAGMSWQESMRAMPQVLAFATAGAFDMAEATDLLTDATKAFGLQNGDVGRMGDAIVKAAKQSNDTVRGFATMLTSDAAVAARGFGMELETTMAVLAAYAAQGKKAGQAGNMLGRSTRLLTASWRDNGEVFQYYGIDIINRSTGTYKNFIDIIGEMENAFRGMTPPMRDAALEQLGFAALAQKAILPLIGMSSEMKNFEKGQKSAAGTMKNVAAKQLKSFINILLKTKNALGVMAVSIGQRLAPIILKFAASLRKMVDGWRKMSAPVQLFIIKIGLVVGALGPMLMLMGGIMLLLSPFAKGFILAGKAASWFAITAIAGLVKLYTFMAGLPALIAWARIEYVSSMVMIKTAWLGLPQVFQVVGAALFAFTGTALTTVSVAMGTAAGYVSIAVTGMKNAFSAAMVYATGAARAFVLQSAGAALASGSIFKGLAVAAKGYMLTLYAASLAAVLGALTASKAMAINALGMIKAAVLGALVAIKVAFTSAIPMIISVATTIGTYIVPIVAVVAAIGTAFAVALAVIHRFTKGSGASFGQWINKIIGGIKKFASNTLGFFYNFGDNIDVLTKWLSENWRALFVGIGKTVAGFFTAWVNNQVVAYRMLGRLTTIFLSWFGGRMFRFFVHELPGLAWRGLKKVGAMFMKVFSKIGKIIYAAFTGDFSAVDKYIKEIKESFRKGLEGESFLGLAGSAIADEMQNFEIPDIGKNFAGMNGPRFNYGRPQGQQGKDDPTAMYEAMMKKQDEQMAQMTKGMDAVSAKNGPLASATKEMERMNEVRENAASLTKRYMPTAGKMAELMKSTREMLDNQLITTDVARAHIADQVNQLRGAVNEVRAPSVAATGTREAYDLALDFWKQQQTPKDDELATLRSIAKDNRLVRQLLQKQQKPRIIEARR